MKRFIPGEVIFLAILPPSVSLPFLKTKIGERNRLPLPQIPFFGIWGRQEGVDH